jgi:hypothetical protein
VGGRRARRRREGRGNLDCHLYRIYKKYKSKDSLFEKKGVHKWRNQRRGREVRELREDQSAILTEGSEERRGERGEGRGLPGVPSQPL